MQGSIGSDQLRGKHPSLNPHSARLPRASDYTPLLLPTSTLSSVLESGLSEGLLKDKSSYTSICGQALSRGLGACRQQERWGRWETVGVGEGMPDLLAEGSLHHCPGISSSSFQGLPPPPPGHTQSTWGRGKRLGTVPEKNICLETFWAVGTLQTKYQYWQVKDNGRASPRDPSTAAHQPLLKACPEMLSQFAGVGWGAEEEWVATLEPESTPWPAETKAEPRNSLNAFGRQPGTVKSQDVQGLNPASFLHRGRSGGGDQLQPFSLFLPKPRCDRATAGQ